jgi:hypothetical protein
MSEGNIKSYLELDIKKYLLGLLICYFAFYFNNEVTIDNNKIDKINLLINLLTNGVFICFVSIAIYAIPSKLKEKMLIFTNPGNVVFDKISQKKWKDERISLSKFKEKYSEFLNEYEESDEKNVQNQYWYSLYVKYKDEKDVYHINKESLFFRDVYILTLLLIVFYICVSVVFHVLNFYLLYFILIFFLAIVLFFTCHSRKKQLVITVIAKDLYH